MRVVLVIPPFLPGYCHSSRSPAVARSGTVSYPIWLAYGGAALEAAGHETLLMDAPALGIDRDETLRRIAAFRPDLAVIDLAAPSAVSDLAFAAILSETLPIAVGGVAVMAHPDSVRDRLPAAVLVRSEYDAALPALCSALERGAPPAAIALTREHLDGGPFVSGFYRRHLDLARYFCACARHPFVAIFAARGCPFACSFCSWPATLSGRRYRTRSPGDIVEEMRFIERELSEVREIFFEDDTFNVREEEVAARCEAMIAAGVRIPWSANFRAKASPEILCLARRAGCRLALVGFESGDDAVLAGMEKGATVEDARRFAEDARRAGLLVHGCFILGVPGETPESIERTIRHAIRLDPDTAQFYPFMAASGGEAALTPAGRHRYAGAEFPAAEIDAFCRAARRRFYLRPGYIARKVIQSLRSGAEFSRNLRAALALFRDPTALKASAKAGDQDRIRA